MRESNPKSRALLACYCAVPLALALAGCGGSSTDSQIGDFGVSNPGRAGGGPDLQLPPPGSGAGAGNGTGGTGSTDPGGGVYMLPADYTKATLGGFKLGSEIDPGATGGAGTPGAGGGTSSCGTSILGVVRDFKGANEPGGHGDFEAFQGTSASKGIVADTLGADQKPVYTAMGAFIDPHNGPQTTTKEAFDQWYRATPNVNKPFIIYLYFQPNGNVLTFQSNAFFPLDGKGWGNTPGQQHNFAFTTEVHTQFNYKGGETFSFTGDDDLWVFINKKLAIDLGGLHRSTSDTVSLDMAAAKLGIAVGGTYDLDLFHAERHTNESNFRVDTNLAFTNCGTIVEEPPVK